MKNRKDKNNESYFSAAAHQLKTPLYGLRFYLEMMKGEELGKLNRKQKEYTGEALKKIEELQSLLDGFLDVIKIEREEYEIKKEKADLAKETEKAVEKFSAMAKASNSRITLERDSSPLFVCTDSEKIPRVIEGLIENSIIYRTEKKGCVEIKLEDKGGRAVFSIKDNGIGVSKEGLKKIFYEPYRAKEALIIDPARKGLTLYIARVIINFSGGKIWLKNNEKEPGATFYFSLPKK